MSPSAAISSLSQSLGASESDIPRGRRRAGLTPSVGIEQLAAGRGSGWIKLEGMNPSGSMKDRSAKAMLDDALADGVISPGATVIESTSGNLGVALAQACRQRRLRLICVVDERACREKLELIRAWGGRVEVVPRGSGEDPLETRLRRVEQLVAETENSWWPNQYANESTARAHELGTAREIFLDSGGDLDYLFVPAGTCGTLRGCLAFFRKNAPDVKVVAVDAVGSALFGGSPGRRTLPGLGAAFETALSREAEPDDVVRISERGSIIGCRRLLAVEGILGGASTGSVVSAWLGYQPARQAGISSFLISADLGISYVETVFDDEWVDAAFGLRFGVDGRPIEGR